MVELPGECDTGVLYGRGMDGRKEGKAMRLIILKLTKEIQNDQAFCEEKRGIMHIAYCILRVHV